MLPNDIIIIYNKRLNKFWECSYDAFFNNWSRFGWEIYESNNLICECKKPRIFESKHVGYNICMDCGRKIDNTKIKQRILPHVSDDEMFKTNIGFHNIPDWLVWIIGVILAALIFCLIIC